MTEHKPSPDVQGSSERPPVDERLKPRDVPVFGCVIYVMPLAGGGWRARLANLSGFECTGASERDVLAKIVADFKKQAAELLKAQTPIPWIDPPAPAEPGEQKRLVPVHL